MKIALIGYGNMGHEIEDLINESDTHQIVSISYKDPSEKLDKDGIGKADVVIDFTSPEVVVSTIKEVAGMGKNMVVGTTGWYDFLPEVKAVVKKSKTGLIYAQNFSIGANIFFKIVGFASSLFGKFGNYDVAGLEIHHRGKKDSPSGTAKKLASVIMENFPKKKKLETDRLDRQISKDELHFASLRAGRNPGYHEVIFDSMSDEIKLSHSAHGRRGFAEGALVAAEFIKGKKGFYSFDEVFKA
ncbi:4-hydroxy-tetrahydrodipicolinate reductase [Candidatus Daviesbacteria bacterium RIFCSPHIGHO2_01_FULL_40_11]|uniref:4-hydroxy-tetrahydrodipicolinate reductase n=1 Tax=Candidatus Daviesbacteria bacterium RIFCSPHIGHO2_01_FULL_40_11 TaxID=1797762 RepID=A0A1F5JFN0_9BACT|nr:MAG: 4-hydroxy-tetrahydrodipicolinate reductase [Candidatus Daviesbacteria bacterium RIFCSPHIGHO2_01_FULL_40_11]OGE62689.1 MAG: 4-hydroxy-tetrahydrodipicolinate reductase [Candidatus Daviesbacteria bacterium RIFCSPLOWO2_01_FULL_40_27]